MITLAHRLPADPAVAPTYTLALSAEERTRSRHRFTSTDGVEMQLLLPRGTTLRDGDLLRNDEDSLTVRVQARPEPVITAHAADAFTLTRAAYHLGNRHVALEFGRDYLRLSPDSVLADLLMQLGLRVVEEIAPFQPEAGAYGNHSHHHDQGIARVPFRQHS
ncbi:MAG: urease accessory protein UreE [Gammaproteobacteria bacterium]|nr:urease accessory protein UreE [Gammaproteobacteria bacterium]